jgi:hypothetical protein
MTLTACHRFEPLPDATPVTGIRGRLTLTPEARASYARRLGGVPIDVTGLLVAVDGDSIGIKADEVRFGDLGTVPFAQGELRFHTRDIAVVSRERLDRGRSTIVGAAATAAILAIATVLSPSNGFFGIGRSRGTTQR